MGAICEYCKRDMVEADGCVDHAYEDDGGRLFSAIAYCSKAEWAIWEPVLSEGVLKAVRESEANGESCHDCGAKPQHFHHEGCDMERCPRCKGQLISCGCEFVGAWAQRAGITESRS